MTNYVDSPPPPSRRRRARIRLPMWGLGLVIFSLIGILLLGGYLVFDTVKSTIGGNSVTQWQPPSVQSTTPPQEVAVVRDGGEGISEPNDDKWTVLPPSRATRVSYSPSGRESDDPLSVLDPDTYKPYEGTERVNILLLGIDIRCDEQPGEPTRTDSMILVSVDPVGRSISVLSLPRDMWVDIPTIGSNRINMAHFRGQTNLYPGGGPALAMETVSAFLGMKIHHYVSVNFEGFRDFINLIDGIQVDVPEDIEDEYYPDSCNGFDPFYVDAGLQNMDGPIALKYARTRPTAGGDIDRARRQQLVLMAVRDKLIDYRVIPQLLRNINRQWENFQDNAHTSMTDVEVIQMAMLLPYIPRENISMHVIDYGMVYTEMVDGQQVLVTNYDLIQQFRDRIFPPLQPPWPEIEDLDELAVEEDVSILMLNTTNAAGLATRTQIHLVGRGLNVEEIGDGGFYRTATRIVDYGDHEYTREYLKELLMIPPLNITQSNEESEYDMVIYLGQDWADKDAIYNPAPAPVYEIEDDTSEE